MHWIRFIAPSGTTKYGELNGDKVTCADQTYPLDEIEVRPPTDPSKIICVGLNYADHAAEAGMDVPDRPLLFLKPKNTVASHGDTIPLLKDKERIDYEAELGVVISRQCRNVPKDRAMEVVDGFTCVNDISNRDDQEIEQNWVRGKAFDNSAPVGPVVASPDEVPSDARIQLRVNGEIKQDSSRDKFIFSVPELIEEITKYITLEPGDIISTGTPFGIGPVEPGDVMEVEIEGVGTLRNKVGTVDTGTYIAPNQ
ncbi:2-hydroxyhepta-2,4-diene-1,7-dioate isomerase [Haloferax sp. Atlit-4N]|uniref:fumarylacetoacetate hydrolase family protein n=1 Tax=unclassified Haloferax TaxID=2625095 RepID=UPI000E24726E|nr:MULTISPECIES: fumarylacetoacetate hydrolase family protein [unclassified Haloferax]RDZ39506.1 2-hydroxyhepta-2,4-diene-1,7-dioate isomerase [Haloferax sp. Atlit-19N]RDZ50218.1 2-hydroxyhepta-2,4-diene-1,7-dioate isomerase [Haloferax sp. Atlit-4N]